jgi:nicotinamide phosphoribosyltransferase
MNSILLTDGYKLGHHLMYPKGTTLVFSNFTPRSDKYAPTACQDKGIVVFGVQMVLKQIHDHFDKHFFKREERKEWDVLAPSEFQQVLHQGELNKLKVQVINEIKSELDLYLNTDYDVTHFEELWDLGYLPIEVRSLEEGTVCPIRVPMLTIHNTLPEFFWITNYLETIISNLLWKPITSASISKAYKEILVNWATKTDKENVGFVDWQGHDFSMRGMDSVDATIASGLGHLTSFLGTDSLPAIWGARNYYNAEGFVAGSVPATEHSVMSANIGCIYDELKNNGSYKGYSLKDYDNKKM